MNECEIGVRLPGRGAYAGESLRERGLCMLCLTAIAVCVTRLHWIRYIPDALSPTRL